MKKIFYVVCGFRDYDGTYNYQLKKVKGASFELDERLFIRYAKECYHLIDKATGLELNHFYHYEDLLDWYENNKNKYEVYLTSSFYKDKVKRFEELKKL